MSHPEGRISAFSEAFLNIGISGTCFYNWIDWMVPVLGLEPSALDEKTGYCQAAHTLPWLQSVIIKFILCWCSYVVRTHHLFTADMKCNCSNLCLCIIIRVQWLMSAILCWLTILLVLLISCSWCYDCAVLLEVLFCAWMLLWCFCHERVKPLKR